MTTPNLDELKRPRAEPSERVLALSVVFGVSRPRMFELWTRDEHRRQWFMPRGMTIEVIEDDLRVGGRYHVVLRDVEGRAVGLRGEYHELVPNERIVFTHDWEDEAEQATLVTVLFTDEDHGTRVTLHQGVFASRDSRDSHVDTWQGTFESLHDYIERTRS